MSILAPNFLKLYGMLGTPVSIAMQEYCKLKHQCRRKHLFQYFDKSDNETELPSGCNCCDICANFCTCFTCC